MHTGRIYNLLWVLVLWTDFGKAEVFTSIAEMEQLLLTQGFLLNSLDKYISSQELNIELLKRQYNEYKKENDFAKKDVNNYLSNPINSYKLLKRLNIDWNMTQEIMKTVHEPAKLLDTAQLNTDLKFPETEDMSGATMGLLRLQNLYKLETEDIAEGKLNGIQYSTPMSASDCHEIGLWTYGLKDYKTAQKWFEKALAKQNKSVIKFPSKIKILEYVAYIEYILGNIEKALNLTKEMVKLDPIFSRVKDNIPYYEALLQNKTQKEAQKPPTTIQSEMRDNYEKLCNDELQIPENLKKRLKCRYVTEHHPFLRLAPLKLEEHYIDPDIVIYHDVIYEEEIAFFKEQARPRFQRAKVVGIGNAPFRISKSAWINESDFQYLHKILQRVKDMTSLDLESAEDFQIANYGIGGHYEPHYDFTKKTDKYMFGTVSGRGNRIATVLFYMTDVPQGGSTVFPYLGVGVRPKKGSAVFWYNLHHSGEGDYATLHAACPVLRGNKWVLNKWIRLRGQEWIRPCNLEYEDEGFKRKIPKPVEKIK